MPTLTIRICGTQPVSWGQNPRTDQWREVVAEKARELINDFQQPDPSTEFHVSLIFFLTRNTSDLDNLAKPVLDTLFHTRNAQVNNLALTGSLFQNIDDPQVFDLILQKRIVKTIIQSGVDIFVSWHSATNRP